MKTFRPFGMLLLAIALCISACGEIETSDAPTPAPKPEEVKSEITIDNNIITNGLSFTNEAGEKSISFTTNEDWTLSIADTQSGDAWCTASATSGTKGSAIVKFSVSENTSYDNRSVSVTIKSGTTSKTFSITQKFVDALLLTTNKYEVGQDGGTIEIEVKANIDYEMEIAENAKGWINEAKSRTLTTYKHILNIASNEEVEKREGEIYFKSGDKVESVKVYQVGGAIILLSKDEYIVSDAGETISVDIKSNIEYGVQMPDVDWITEEATTRGMSSHTLKYTVSPNEEYDSRSAEIIFFDNNGDLRDTLKVVQCQKDAIILSEKNISLSSNSGNFEVKLSANIEFEIEMPEVDWIKQVSSRALSDHTIKFYVSANVGTKSRTVNIIFTNKEKGVNETLVVTQQSDYGYFQFKGYNVGSVKLYQAGTLEKTLESVGEPLDRVIKLYVSGPINGDDIYYLREIYNNLKAIGKFQVLDLSEASIVEGGNKYKTYNNEIHYCMFEELPNLCSITLPDNAISIGRDAFYNCPDLLSVSMGDKVVSIGYAAFADCDKLYRVSIGKGVTSIGERCFDECALSSIIIPDNVTYIGESAFVECQNLESVTMGDGVTRINYSTFSNCMALKSITLSKNITYIDDYAFAACASLTSIDIPDGVTRISKSTFEGCTSLISIDIHDGVEEIGVGAFADCSSIKSITIGNNIKSISGGAFSGCSSLESVVIPNSVTSIGYNAFNGCSSMKSITIGNGVTTIYPNAFYGCNALASVYITDLSAWCNIDFRREVYEYDDYYYSRYYKAECNPLFNKAKLYLNNKEITELTIPKDITKINDNAFFGCSSITSVTIGDNVTDIGFAAFRRCESLSKVSLGKRVEEIKDTAFAETSIMECYSYNSTPPHIYRYVYDVALGTFDRAIEKEAVLYLPKGSLEKYMSSWDYYYEKFGRVIEMD